MQGVSPKLIGLINEFGHAFNISEICGDMTGPVGVAAVPLELLRENK